MAQYIKGDNKDTLMDVSDELFNSSSVPGGYTFGQQLLNSGYSVYNPSIQQPKQPSLTVNSSDLNNRPLVSPQPSTYSPPKLPTYTPPPTPTYTPPNQQTLPELPKLQQINVGNVPIVQSTDELLKEVQSKFQPLNQQDEQVIRQNVRAGFDPQFAEQRRVNDLRNLFAKAAAAQRGDFDFGASELAYTGLANVQQSGADALARLRAAQVAEENTRIQAANETNRARQIELFNMANQLRDQQQREFQTYIQNQVTANDRALQEYKLKLDNTRFFNEQERQKALDQFEAAKYKNELERQRYQDELQAYNLEREQAKDTLAMISELGAKEISNLGGLQDLEASIGLPTGFINALQQTKLSAENAKNNAQIAEVYNQGVQLAMSLPVGQSFSLKNPDGSVTTFQGTQPDEFQIINNSSGVWRVNKNTGEITELQSFSSSSGGGGGGGSRSSPGNLPTPIPSNLSQISNQTSKATLGGGVLAGANVGVGEPIVSKAQPKIDLSKFDPTVQLIINGQYSIKDLGVSEIKRLSGQINQASKLGLLPGQGNSGTLSDQQQTSLDKTPEVKKLTTLSDFKSKLSRYNNLVDTYGIQLSGSNKAKLDQAYADLKISYKNAADLGALAGPDLEILIDAIKPATGISGLKQKITGGGVTGIKNSITQMISNVNEDAQKNINLLNTRNPAYKNSDYVKELTSPFGSNSSSGIDSVKNQYGINY